MAFITDEHCHVCGKTTPHNHRACSECNMRKEKERIHDWHSQPLDAKLDDLRKRVEKLEDGPIRFA